MTTHTAPRHVNLHNLRNGDLLVNADGSESTFVSKSTNGRAWFLSVLSPCGTSAMFHSEHKFGEEGSEHLSVLARPMVRR